MNKTAIEWTDFTWNPLTGCWGPGGTAEKPNRCSYCYGVKIANRFHDRYPDIDPFAPTFYPDRLSEPGKAKKSSKIFVCSMADLFGDWVPGERIAQVRDVALLTPQHIFQFLTKNPKRLKDCNPWPSNCWVGTTVTNQADDWRIVELLKVEAPVLFVSHEPLLGETDVTPYLPLEHCPNCKNTGYPWIECGNEHSGYDFRQKCECLSQPYIDWAIIGAMTGPGAVKPRPEWVQGLVEQYRAAGVPVFLKDNLNWPEKIQEYPRGPLEPAPIKGAP